MRDAQETPDRGGLLTADGSDFLNALIAAQDDPNSVDAVSGSTVTSDSLKKAVGFANAFYAQQD